MSEAWTQCTGVDIGGGFLFDSISGFFCSLTQQEQEDLLLAQAIAASQEENRREQRRRVCLKTHN